MLYHGITKFNIKFILPLVLINLTRWAGPDYQLLSTWDVSQNSPVLHVIRFYHIKLYLDSILLKGLILQFSIYE